MSDLLRRQYERPAILAAQVQVLLDWDPKQMESFVETIDAEARAAFPGVSHNVENTVNFEFRDEQPSQSVTRSFDGATIALDEHGSQLLIEASGYRIALKGPYPGRERLFELSTWMEERLNSFDPDLHSTRVSVVFQANVDPGDSLFEISDYIVPRFEFADPKLNFFRYFLNDVMIDLSHVKDGPYRCRVAVGTSPQHSGFNVMVDVLDDGRTPVSQVKERLETVKALESHVFENLITDKTRELYGVIS